MQDKVNGLLGFRVTERGNDAIVEFFEEPISPITGPKVRAVHPATVQEVALYLKVLGLVARMDELTEENARLQNRIKQASVDQDAMQARLDDAIERNNRLENECDSLLKQRDEAADDSASARVRFEEEVAKHGERLKRDRKMGQK